MRPSARPPTLTSSAILTQVRASDDEDDANFVPLAFMFLKLVALYKRIGCHQKSPLLKIVLINVAIDVRGRYLDTIIVYTCCVVRLSWFGFLVFFY